MILFLGLVVIALAVIAILKGIDVRLALLLAAVLLGALVNDLSAIVRAFLATFSRDQFVVPICTAMGFAHVLRLTQCDQHLVHLLVKPLERVQIFVLPGAVLVGFLVNIPIISQTSTAVSIGPVLIPLMLAARISPVTAGAALLLGASLGGELLNPGAPELRTVSSKLGVNATDCVNRVFPLLLVQLGVATAVFWGLGLRAQRRARHGGEESTREPIRDDFKVNVVKALVPLVPLVLLFATGAPFYFFKVPREWLIDVKNAAEDRVFDGRLIGAAMLVGVVAAAVTSPASVPKVARSFFEGAGYAFTHIISLIVTASCFGAGVEKIGLADLIGAMAGAAPGMLVPSAGGLPLAFAWISGSGMASTQSLYQFFADPAIALGLDPMRVGAVVSIGAAAGRTMSPVSAVALMCASLTGTNSIELGKQVAVPLLVGIVAVVLTARMM